MAKQPFLIFLFVFVFLPNVTFPRALLQSPPSCLLNPPPVLSPSLSYAPLLKPEFDEHILKLLALLFGSMTAGASILGISNCVLKYRRSTVNVYGHGNTVNIYGDGAEGVHGGTSDNSGEVEVDASDIEAAAEVIEAAEEGD